MGADIRRERRRQVRQRLDGWVYVARDRAYGELFADGDGVLTEEELETLDGIDSDLNERTGVGLWGADEYEVVETGAVDGDPPLRVVCTNHPRIPYEGYRGGESLDEATREELNDVLWDYCERVTDHVQRELNEFLDASDTGTKSSERFA